MIGVVVLMAWILWHDYLNHTRTEELKAEIRQLRKEVTGDE